MPKILENSHYHTDIKQIPAPNGTKQGDIVNWDWFKVMYSLAAVFMVVDILWRFAFIPFALFSMAFKDSLQKWVIMIFSIIPYYIMASYAVIICLSANDGYPSIFLFVVAGLFLFLSAGTGIASQQRQAEREWDYRTAEIMEVKFYSLLIGLIYFIYATIDHRPAFTKPIVWIAEVFDWINSINWLNVIIAVISFLYVIYMIFIGIIAILGILASIGSKNKSA